MSTTVTPRIGRSRLANAVKSGAPAEAITEARRNLASANIEAFVTRTLAVAPALSDEQVERIAERLRGAAGSEAGA